VVFILVDCRHAFTLHHFLLPHSQALLGPCDRHIVDSKTLVLALIACPFFIAACLSTDLLNPIYATSSRLSAAPLTVHVAVIVVAADRLRYPPFLRYLHGHGGVFAGLTLTVIRKHFLRFILILLSPPRGILIMFRPCRSGCHHWPS